MQGTTRDLKGDITSLRFLSVLDPRQMELALGFAPGRLRQGYAIALLREPVAIDEFLLGGMTYFSGGREGLPRDTKDEDERRPHIDDRVRAEYPDGGRGIRTLAAAAINRLVGPDRTAKVLPVIPHDNDLAPSAQYPRGLGVPQWSLKNRKRFRVALEVAANGRIRAHGFDFANAAATTVDDRIRLLHFLARA